MILLVQLNLIKFYCVQQAPVFLVIWSFYCCRPAVRGTNPRHCLQGRPWGWVGWASEVMGPLNMY